MGLYGKENPVGVSLRGVVSGLDLFSVTSEGGDDEKQGEQQAKPEITENAE